MTWKHLAKENVRIVMIFSRRLFDMYEDENRPDPRISYATQLGYLREMQDELTKAELRLVKEMRDSVRMSWEEIGYELGTSRQGAQQKYKRATDAGLV